jgi:predicted ribosomally synthesized peptide with nif11-like leader
MSQELNNFFAKITADQALQERLYVTKELADVAVIAQELGFQVTGADILRAQAGRVLSLPAEELETVASGKKAKTGAQWGRAGNGYLERAGFWINEFMRWGYPEKMTETPIILFLAKVKDDKTLQEQLLPLKSYNDVAKVAQVQGFDLSGGDLLRCQATQILKLSDEQAEKVARGNISGNN